MFQYLCIFLTGLTISMNTFSQQAYTPPKFTDPHRLEKLQNIFPIISSMYQDYAQKNQVPSYAFGIMLDGKLVYTGHAGVTQVGGKVPVDAESMFRIASMTKSFTAMAILKLRDMGKLNLDDPVLQYVPALKGQNLTADARQISIRDLLTHGAGFPQDDPWGDRQLNISNEALHQLLKDKLSFSNAAGDAFEYSNLGYAILGLIVTEVSQMPYQEFIRKHIWQPLGLQQASWDYKDIAPDKLVQGYSWKTDAWQEAPMLADGSFGAMGGMITSIEAFSRYVALHQQASPARDEEDLGPISRTALREMQKPWQFDELDTSFKFLSGESCTMVSAYGYGLRWHKDCKNRTFVGHSGGLPGFGSNWLIMPEYGLGVILFANKTYAGAEDINLDVLNTILQKTKLKARTLPPSKVLLERQKALVKLLPNWEGAKDAGIFAENFFLDASLEERQKESQALFKEAGKVLQVSRMVAENQLRGHFMVKALQGKFKVQFTLTPQREALIQELKIEKVV